MDKKTELKKQMQNLADKINFMESQRNAMKLGLSRKYVSLRDLIILKKEFAKLQKQYEKI